MSNIAPAPIFSPEEIGEHCLVTGGAGYVGRAIIQRLLAAGCRVRSFDVLDHDHGEAVQSVTGNLRHYDDVLAACDGIDTVFHTAALIKITTLNRASVRKRVFDVNVGGTENILKAAAVANVKALVHTSTGNVVMDRVLVGKDETLPYATRTHDLYSVSKIAAEKLALAADNPDGLRVCAVRPGGLWGSDTNSMMVLSFLEQLVAGKFTALIGNGTSVMDNTHIDNLVDGQLLAAKALHKKPETAGGQAYFIFDDEQINPLEWFKPIAEGLGYTYPSLRLPGSLMKVVAWLMEAAHYLGAPEPVLTVRAVRNLIESSSFRIDKARRDLGYEPRFKLENGLPLLLPQARAYIQAGQPRTAR